MQQYTNFVVANVAWSLGVSFLKNQEGYCGRDGSGQEPRPDGKDRPSAILGNAVRAEPYWAPIEAISKNERNDHDDQPTQIYWESEGKEYNAD